MLEAQRAELERQGYRVVASLPDGFVASRAKWHWDCMVTKLSMLVLVREVAQVDEATITADLVSLAKNAASYDPSALPRGFQKGRGLVAFYVAGRATPGAVALATSRPKIQFASIPLVGIVEPAGAHYYQETPFVGGIYFSKFRYLLSRLAAPTTPGADTEPLSIPGIVLTSVTGACIVGPFCCLPFACLVTWALH